MLRKCVFGILLLTVAVIFSATPVFAYTSTLTISDNSRLFAEAKEHKTGMHRVRFSVDAWKSNICKSSSDSSHLVVSVVRGATNIQYAGGVANTKLYVCVDQALGNITGGSYFYRYYTYADGGNAFCGFKSDWFNYGVL